MKIQMQGLCRYLCNGPVIVAMPLVHFMVWLSNAISRLFGAERRGDMPFVTEDEIKTLVDAGDERIPIAWAHDQLGIETATEDDDGVTEPVFQRATTNPTDDDDDETNPDDGDEGDSEDED